MGNFLHKSFKISFVLSILFLASNLKAQTTFQGNGNTGFGDAIGTGSIEIQDNGTTATITVNTGSGQFNDFLVIYFDTGADGRNVIDSDVNDQNDDNRRAISSAGTDASVINFPPGFEARYAISVNTGFGGLWEIPAPQATPIVNNQLPFVTTVGNPANNSVASFSMTFNWSDIGLTGASTDNLDFVATYVNGSNGYLSNEGYGGGFDEGTADTNNNYGSQTLNITQYFRYTPGGTVAKVGGVAATAQDGNYSADATWSNGNVPFLEDWIVINDVIDVDQNTTIANLEIIQSYANVPSLTVNSGSTLISTGTVETNGFDFKVDGTLTTVGSTFNGNITIGATGILDVQTGVATFNNDLLFLSDIVTGTPQSGQIDQVNGTLVVNGESSVEIYVPAATENTRAFRFISSTVTTTNPLSANWQDDQDGNPAVTTSGVGTHITGNGGAANGFDTTISNNPSAFTFDNTYVNSSPTAGVNPQIDAWNPLANTSGILEAGVPYRLFVRGDRNYDLTSSPANAPNNDTRLVSAGELTNGPVLMDNLSEEAGYFSLIGNPYQAIVDAGALTYTNTNGSQIYVWDPNEGLNGLYVSINTSSGTSGPTSSDATQFLIPGQAFFVETIASSAASVLFEEVDKAVEEPFTLVNRNQNEAKIDVRLFSADRFAQGLSQNNAFGIRFDPSFNNEVDRYDAGLFYNDAENLYTTINGKKLMVELRKAPVAEEVIPVSIVDYRFSDYVLNINRANLNLASNLDVQLFDSFTNTTVAIPDGITNYNFSVNPNDPASINQDRFEIQFVDGTLSNDQFDLDRVALYPNPAQGAFTIEVPFTTETTVRVYNALGQEMIKRTSSDSQINIDGNSLKNGLYIVKITNGDQEISKKLIMK
ncbi:hypothetical protein BST97_07435 [Nonlabens spongiae]|uniref:Secretion system C-terminal sorting domain-containing protein n=1 Tax=Nonlabens spongiae TaxID=331648 RepID=A0A1W6MJU8_9FLAO|nr:T9SS type A sorting domain-containing protein [Nonlabens spongiae]ARN77847.1 hypothetical protein BST97_07435 [Nonlabens spongiae]